MLHVSTVAPFFGHPTFDEQFKFLSTLFSKSFPRHPRILPFSQDHILFLDLCSQALSVRVQGRETSSVWYCNIYYFRYAAGRQNFWNELWLNRSPNVICFHILYEFISWDAEATVFPVSLRCIQWLTQSYSNCVSRIKQIHFYSDLSDMNFVYFNCIIRSHIFEWCVRA